MHCDAHMLASVVAFLSYWVVKLNCGGSRWVGSIVELALKGVEEELTLSASGLMDVLVWAVSGSVGVEE